MSPALRIFRRVPAARASSESSESERADMSNTAAIQIPWIVAQQRYCDGYPLYTATSYLLGLAGGAGAGSPSRVLFQFALTAVSVQYLHTGSPFGLFLFSLALFHFSEYLWTSIYHRRIMSWDCTCYLTRSALP